MNTGGASSVGGENIRPSRDVRFLLIPEFPGFSHGEYVKVGTANEMLLPYDNKLSSIDNCCRMEVS